MSSEIVRGRIPKDLRKEFLALAAERGLNESAAINYVISQFVNREKEIRRRNEETLDALADVEAGLVVEGDRVLEWIASWGSGDEKEPPR